MLAIGPQPFRIHPYFFKFPAEARRIELASLIAAKLTWCFRALLIGGPGWYQTGTHPGDAAEEPV